MANPIVRPGLRSAWDLTTHSRMAKQSSHRHSSISPTIWLSPPSLSANASSGSCRRRKRRSSARLNSMRSRNPVSRKKSKTDDNVEKLQSQIWHTDGEEQQVKQVQRQLELELRQLQRPPRSCGNWKRAYHTGQAGRLPERRGIGGVGCRMAVENHANEKIREGPYAARAKVSPSRSIRFFSSRMASVGNSVNSCMSRVSFNPLMVASPTVVR